MTGGWEQDGGDPYAYDEVSTAPAAHPTPSPGVTSRPVAPAARTPAESQPATPGAAHTVAPSSSGPSIAGRGIPGRGGAIWAVSLAVVGLLMGSMYTDVQPFALIRPMPNAVAIFIIITAGLVGLVAVVRPGVGWRIRVAGGVALLIAGWAIIPPLVTATLISRQLAAESVALGGQQNHAALGDEVRLGDWLVTIDVVNRDGNDWYRAAFPDERLDFSETAVVISGAARLVHNADATDGISGPNLRIDTAGESWSAWSEENVIPGVESQTAFFQPATETRITWVAKLPNEALEVGMPITLKVSADRPEDDLVTLEGPTFIAATVDAGRRSLLPAWLPDEATP